MRLKTLLLLLAGLLSITCSNDDDTNDTPSIDTTDLVGATATITVIDAATIDLSTGDQIATEENSFNASTIYQNSFVALFDDRIVRSNTTDVQGDQIWEYYFPEDPGFYYDTSFSSIIQGEGVLYYTYRLINETTFESFYFIEALNLENGTPLWTTWVNQELRQLALLNNTLIVAQGNNTDGLLTSRSITDGTVQNTWILPERISHLVVGLNEVIIMSWSNRVHSIQEDLSLNWTFETDGANVRRGAIVDNQFIFHSRDDFIYALNLQTGGINWSQHLPDLSIEDFFEKNNSIWSITHDSAQNTFNINEIKINDGSSLSNFSTSVAVNMQEIEMLQFQDYLLIVTGINSGATLTQLFNYQSQDLIWQNEIDLNNVYSLKANILMNNTRFAITSF